MKNFGYQARRGAMVALALTWVVTLSGCAIIEGFMKPANPLVGSWNMTSVSALGTNQMVLTVAEDLTGTIASEDPAGNLPISDTVVEGMAVSFAITFDFQGTELPAVFEGTIDGDSITGQFITDFGNADVTGTRAE